MASSTVWSNLGLLVIDPVDFPDWTDRWSMPRGSADKCDPLIRLEPVALGKESSSTVLGHSNTWLSIGCFDFSAHAASAPTVAAVMALSAARYSWLVA